MNNVSKFYHGDASKPFRGDSADFFVRGGGVGRLLLRKNRFLPLINKADIFSVFLVFFPSELTMHEFFSSMWGLQGILKSLPITPSPFKSPNFN